MSLSGAHGIVYPDELRALESVFEEACRTTKITRASPEGERIALKIVLLFQGGIDDRGQLLEVPDPDEDQDDNLKCN